MIDDNALRTLIRASIPDARVDIYDRTGTQDHYTLTISSQHFTGKSKFEQIKMVNEALQPARIDGRLHAAEIKTQLLESN